MAEQPVSVKRDEVIADQVVITRDEVAHVARLARLGLTDAEVDTYAAQLADILGHVGEIARIDLSDSPPMVHALPVENVLRSDVVGTSLSQSDVLSGAPLVEQGRFRVPRILDEPA